MMPKRRKNETDDMYRARCLAWLLLPRRNRPRRPKQRKGEEWSDYLLRYEVWAWLYAPRPNLEQGRRWAAARERIYAASAKRAARLREESVGAGRFMPFEVPHYTCNRAGLDYLRRGGKFLPVEAYVCPWTGAVCKFPERGDLLAGAKRAPVGYVRIVRPFPAKQMALLADYYQPLADYNVYPCCVEGAERYASQRRKNGFEVTVYYEAAGSVQAEYEALFGLRPCFK